MNTRSIGHPSHGTAKIYAFPIGGRASVQATVNGDIPQALITQTRVATTPCNGGWYHDAAIEDAAKRTQ